jgi:hypothetical protein
LGDSLLHPGRGALSAAVGELDRLLASAGPEDTLVVCGAGLGWHAKAAARGPASVVVYEPDARRRAMMSCLGPPLGGAELAADDNALVEALAGRLVYSGEEKPGRVAVYAPPAYRRAEPEMVERAGRLVREAMSRAQSDRQTRRRLSGRWLANLTHNFQQVVKIPDATATQGILRGTPAVVVGAGPSLDQSLDHMRQAYGRAVVLAAASALGPLAAAGVSPLAAVALEAQDESRQFEQARQNQTWLLAATSGHPRHFTEWKGPKALFHLQEWAASLAGAPTALPTGGHATSAAFSLAVLWGCDPIILVGQDLAYTGGRIHASGRPGGEDESRPETRQVEALGGGKVETSAVMHSYIGWYQETAAYLAGRPRTVRVINATAQGARLEGFEHLSLEQTLEELPVERALPDLGALRQARLPRAEAVSQRCLAAAVEARQAQAAAQSQGLAAARARAGGPAAAMLRDADGPEAAERALAELARALRRMAEAVYA